MILPSGYVVHAFNTIGSTNDEAKSQAEQGAPSGTIIWAREQTAGRGRRGRGWVSPIGNLYCSTLLRFPKSVPNPALLSFAATLAIADTAQVFLPPHRRVTLKWPNDVLVEGAKVSGMLLEADLATPQPWIVIGIGMNLISHPPETPYPCTDLTEQGADGAPLEKVLPTLIQHLDHWKKVWIEQGFGAVREEWLKRCHGMGQPIVARLSHQELSGIFESLNDDGALVLKTPDGQRHFITAADIFFPAVSIIPEAF